MSYEFIHPIPESSFRDLCLLEPAYAACQTLVTDGDFSLEEHLPVLRIFKAKGSRGLNAKQALENLNISMFPRTLGAGKVRG